MNPPSKRRSSTTRTRFASVAMIVIVLVALGAAGVWRLFHTNPPFQVLLSDDVVTPLSTDHPVSAGVKWRSLSVISGDGTVRPLDPSLLPALVVAYWCPHCQRTLLLFMRHEHSLRQKPILISTGFVAGTTLAQAEALTREEQRALGLTGFQMDYGLAGWQGVVKQFPTLVIDHKGAWELLQGEHTWSAWHEALAQ